MDLPIDSCGNGVAAPVVQAIIAAESGGRPWAINVNEKDGEPAPLLVPARSEAEAVAQAKALKAQGYSFDVGLMQVNSANVARLGVALDAAFDVCTNLQMGTTVFNEFAAGAGELGAQFSTAEAQLLATLSAYNTGSYRRGFANGYVHRVMRHLGQPIGSAQADLAAENAPMEVALSFGSDVVEVDEPFVVGD